MTTTLEAPTGVKLIRTAGDLHTRPPELTVPEMLHRSLQRHAESVALRFKAEGEWRSMTYGELGRRVRDLALGLAELGVEHGDRVGLLSENRPEWAYCDLAILSLGGVNVPLYSTLPPPQVEYILADSQARVAIASNEKQLEKILEVRERLPALRHVIVVDPPPHLPEGVVTLEGVMEKGRAVEGGDERLRARQDRVSPRDLASIIYTSGTTGNPKGAMLTHDNFMSNAQIAYLVGITPRDVFLSFLPLSHVFERMAGHYFPLSVGAQIAYAESIFTVQTNMTEVHPTIMASVPRLYETIHSRVLDGIRKQPEKKRKIAEWAIRVGWEYWSRAIEGKHPGLKARLLYPLADRLVLADLRRRVTGGKMRYFISGGAPLPVETARFITSMGLRILEGYGLTETSPVISVNRPEKTKLGTVGPPIPGVQVAIAEDGEILSRGPHIMVGYFGKEEETRQAIEPDGWFHTGDIGVLDDDDYLRITDRKKDLIVLANGKNVAPQPIEAQIKASRYIASVVLFGDRQPQVVALIVPDFEHLRAWAKEQGIEDRSPEALAKDAKVKKLLREEIDRLTADRADYEQVRRFVVLERDFSVDRGELTPTLKIKRRVVFEHNKEAVQSLYGGKG